MYRHCSNTTRRRPVQPSALSYKGSAQTAAICHEIRRDEGTTKCSTDRKIKLYDGTRALASIGGSMSTYSLDNVPERAQIYLTYLTHFVRDVTNTKVPAIMFITNLSLL